MGSGEMNLCPIFCHQSLPPALSRLFLGHVFLITQLALAEKLTMQKKLHPFDEAGIEEDGALSRETILSLDSILGGQ
jgi:hypothetical protein